MSARISSLALCTLILAMATTGCSRHAGPTATPAAQSDSASTDQRADNKHEAWQQAGASVQGRPLRVLTRGHGPRKVLFIGGIHGDEAEGSYATSELPGAFDTAGLADAVTLTILEDANPDGRAAHTRENANGVDLNRNFPATNFDRTNKSSGGSPISQPESRAVVELIERAVPVLIMVVHSWKDEQFINFDGPARSAAQQFSSASGISVTDSGSIPPTPGSLGSFAGRDRGISILTIELRKGSDPIADWSQIRAAVLQAIRGE